MSGVAYRGVAADQDVRFSNKQKALLKAIKFPPEFSQKADLSRVNWDSIKAWINKRLLEIMHGVEDEILQAFVIEEVCKPKLDPRIVQINLTGFLEGSTPAFVQELWNLLLSAAETTSGVPQKFLDEAAAELRQRQAERDAMQKKLAEERAKQDALRAEHEAAEKTRRRDGGRRRRDHNDEYSDDERRGRSNWRRTSRRSRSRTNSRSASRSRSRSRGRDDRRRDRRRRSSSRSTSRVRNRRNSRRDDSRDGYRRRRRSRSASKNRPRSRSHSKSRR